MAEIINLRQARKNKQRADKEKTATQNRAKFGQKKSSKKLADKEAAKLQENLDGARIEDPEA